MHRILTLVYHISYSLLPYFVGESISYFNWKQVFIVGTSFSYTTHIECLLTLQRTYIIRKAKAKKEQIKP